MQINQLHPRFVGEIIGLDTSAPITLETVQIVENAMAKYAVCVIRDASLSDEDHIRFSRAFGPLELPPGGGRRIARELYDISNLDLNGEIAPPSLFQSMDFERFHTDRPFNSSPTKWSLLLGYIVPPVGANTDFVDTRAVYEDLPDETKRRIDSLVAEHDLFRALERNGAKIDNEEMRRTLPRMAHPLVRISASGRKALYLGWHAVSIVGWSREQGEALLDQLFARATQDQYIYSHKWRQGDLVIWDNRCTMHAATPFERTRYKRDCRRTTLYERQAQPAQAGAAQAAV